MHLEETYIPQVNFTNKSSRRTYGFDVSVAGDERKPVREALGARQLSNAEDAMVLYITEGQKEQWSVDEEHATDERPTR